MFENNDDVNQLYCGEILLCYVFCIVDDILYVLGKVLYRDMKIVSWIVVDFGKLIYVFKVVIYFGVMFWNFN